MANDKSCKVHIRAYDVDNGRSDNVTVVLPANNNDNYNINNNINGNDNNDNAAEQPKIRETRQSPTTTADDASSDHPKVQNLEIEKTGDSKVTLTWKAPANSDNKVVHYYSISYNCPATGNTYTTFTTDFTFTSIDNLDINGLCTFHVTPIYLNSGGINSTITLTAPLKDLPDNIQLTAAMDGSDAIEVSWHPISSDVFAYNLEWNDPTEGSSGFIPFGTKNFVDGNRSTSHIIKDIVPGYTYTIALTLYYGTDADIEFVHRVTIIEYTVPSHNADATPPVSQPVAPDPITGGGYAIDGEKLKVKKWTAPLSTGTSPLASYAVTYTCAPVSGAADTGTSTYTVLQYDALADPFVLLTASYEIDSCSSVSVAASNSDSTSTLVDLSPLTAPPAPTNLRFSTDYGVLLDWDAPASFGSGSLKHYEVTFSCNDGTDGVKTITQSDGVTQARLTDSADANPTTKCNVGIHAENTDGMHSPVAVKSSYPGPIEGGSYYTHFNILSLEKWYPSTLPNVSPTASYRIDYTCTTNTQVTGSFTLTAQRISEFGTPSNRDTSYLKDLYATIQSCSSVTVTAIDSDGVSGAPTSLPYN